MNNHSEPYSSNGEHPGGFWARLLMAKGFIGRLANLLNVTEQDLMEAGVYLHQTRD